MSRRKETPFDKALKVHVRLDMFVRHGHHALGGQSLEDFIADVHEAYGYLMDFRNIVNSMASFDVAPKEAAQAHID